MKSKSSEEKVQNIREIYDAVFAKSWDWYLDTRRRKISQIDSFVWPVLREDLTFSHFPGILGENVKLGKMPF